MSSDHFDEASLEPAGAPPSVEAPDPTGVARLWTIVFSPGKTFESIAIKPQTWIPILAMLVAVGLVTAMTVHISAPEQLEAALDGPFGDTLDTEEYYQQIEDAADPSTVDRLKGALQGGVMLVVFTAIGALIYFLFLKIFGSKAGLKLTLGVVFWCGWVGVGLGTLAAWPLIVSKGSAMTVGYSLAAILGAVNAEVETSSFTYRFLQTFTSAFSIWQLFLTAMGFNIALGLSKGKAWAAALIPWLLFSGFGLAMYMIFA